MSDKSVAQTVKQKPYGILATLSLVLSGVFFFLARKYSDDGMNFPVDKAIEVSTFALFAVFLAMSLILLGLKFRNGINRAQNTEIQIDQKNFGYLPLLTSLTLFIIVFRWVKQYWDSIQISPVLLSKNMTYFSMTILVFFLILATAAVFAFLTVGVLRYKSNIETFFTTINTRFPRLFKMLGILVLAVILIAGSSYFVRASIDRNNSECIGSVYEMPGDELKC